MKSNKKLIIAALVGSIGISVLGLSLSFAWYNSSENLYLDTLVINVSSTRNLLISTENNMDSMVSKLTYNGGEDSNLPNKSPFRPVSTMFKSNWIDAKEDTPIFYDYPSPKVDDVTHDPIYKQSNPEWGYFCEHLYIYSDTDTKVTVDPDSFKITTNRTLNENRAKDLLKTSYYRNKYANEHPDWGDNEIIKDLADKMERLVKSLRVAILDIDLSSYKFSIINPYKEEDGDVYFGGRQDLFLSGYYDHYFNSDDNENYEILYGEVNDRSYAVYGEKAEADTSLVGEYTSFNSKTKKGVHPLDLQASLDNGLEIKKEESLALSEVEDNIRFDLIGGDIKEFVLAIYMEGWDLDCVNSHMGGNFNINLDFKVAETIDQ